MTAQIRWEIAQLFNVQEKVMQFIWQGESDAYIHSVVNYAEAE